MSKNILFGDEARLKMFAGMEKVAKTVVSTMGPKGRNVIFSKSFGKIFLFSFTFVVFDLDIGLYAGSGVHGRSSIHCRISFLLFFYAGSAHHGNVE